MRKAKRYLWMFPYADAWSYLGFTEAVGMVVCERYLFDSGYLFVVSIGVLRDSSE